MKTIIGGLLACGSCVYFKLNTNMDIMTIGIIGVVVLAVVVGGAMIASTRN